MKISKEDKERLLKNSKEPAPKGFVFIGNGTSPSLIEKYDLNASDLYSYEDGSKTKLISGFLAQYQVINFT